MSTPRNYTITLDLTDSDDYATVVNALGEYADDHEHRAAAEQEPDPEGRRADAARARRILEDIEAQIDTAATTRP